jgi:hypothetical protein
MLPAQWLEETLERARALLHRDDLFMQALERQREPMAQPQWLVPGRALEVDPAGQGPAAGWRA